MATRGPQILFVRPPVDPEPPSLSNRLSHPLTTLVEMHNQYDYHYLPDPDSGRRRLHLAPLPTPLQRAYQSDSPLSVWASDLAALVGGLTELENLHHERTVRHGFDWSVVPPNDVEIVTELLDSLANADLWFTDDEFRELLLHLIEVAAAHPGRPLRARGKPARLAAALTWILMTGNGELGRRRRCIARDIWESYDVSSCKALADTMAGRMNMFDHGQVYSRHAGEPLVLGRPDLLHSDYRRRLTLQRLELIRAVETHEAQLEEERLLYDLHGSQTELQARAISVPQIVKVTDADGRAQVTMLFGESVAEPDDVVALSIPDAHDFLARLERALQAPLVGL